MPAPVMIANSKSRAARWPADGLTDARATVMSAVPLAAVACLAVVLWTLDARRIDPRHVGDLGLVGELSHVMVLSLVLISAAFAFALRMRPLVIPLIAFQVAGLIFMLYGLGTLIHEVPRFPTTWTHAGIAEAITRTGELHPLADARYDWPVFFVLLAFLTEIGGLDSAVQLATWVPVISNLLYVPALVLIFSSATSDRRLMWLAVWIFCAANWIDQDYLSPQGFNYLLYLVILGILLRWFSPSTAATLPWLDRARDRLFGRLRPDAVAWQVSALDTSPGTPVQRMALVGIMVLLYAAMVSSHQLTPFALMASVTALVVARRCMLRGLPILMAVMLGTWLSFMSVTYLAGHLPELLAQIGDTGNVVGANVTGRISGDDERKTIIYVRLGLSAAVWLSAAIGGLRRLWNGYWDVSLALLAIIPFGTLVLQSYGGEILLRIFLFSLPFMAFFFAGLFYPGPGLASIRTTLAVMGVSVLLMCMMVAARYGNERAELLTAEEVTAVDFVHSVADAGDVVVGATPNSPFQYRNFELFPRVFVFFGFMEDDPEWIAETLSDIPAEDTFLMITRAQIAGLELYLGAPPGQAEHVVEALRKRADFDVVFENRDAIVFKFDDASETN